MRCQGLVARPGPTSTLALLPPTHPLFSRFYDAELLMARTRLPSPAGGGTGACHRHCEAGRVCCFPREFAASAGSPRCGVWAGTGSSVWPSSIGDSGLPGRARTGPGEGQAGAKLAVGADAMDARQEGKLRHGETPWRGFPGRSVVELGTDPRCPGRLAGSPYCCRALCLVREQGQGGPQPPSRYSDPPARILSCLASCFPASRAEQAFCRPLASQPRASRGGGQCGGRGARGLEGPADRQALRSRCRTHLVLPRHIQRLCAWVQPQGKIPPTCAPQSPLL